MDRSLIRPAIGFSTTSHAFGANTMTPATAAVMPRVSVRNGSSIRPGTVPKVPVATEPIPYPARTRVGRMPADDRPEGGRLVGPVPVAGLWDTEEI